MNQSKTQKQIFDYLDAHGVVDKDLALPHKLRKTNSAPKIHKIRNRQVLDLHGFKQPEAEARLKTELQRCIDNGLKTLLVIHGHGIHSKPGEGPVLKGLVRDVLEYKANQKLIRSYRTATSKDGGEGATVVLF
jgi:DNA-nicking Smr family endonuclease